MTNIKACVFNAYGALLDTYLPFEEYKDRLGENALVIYKLWRSKRLQYSSQLSLMDRYTHYDTITKYALEFACNVYGIHDEAILKSILESRAKLDCYPDVQEALASIKSKRIKMAVLSNGAPKKLHDTLKHAGIDKFLDGGIYSTEQIKTYKPSPAVYEYVEEQLALPRNKICFISSNSWDIAGASSYGLHSIWVNRNGRTPEILPYKADQEVQSLSEISSSF